MLYPILILIFISNFCFSYISDLGPEMRNNDSLSAISQEVFSQKMSCMKSMTDSAHSPIFIKGYFQQLNNSLVLTVRCEELTSPENLNFVFVFNYEIYLLDLPKYEFKEILPNGEVKLKLYPQQITKFNYLNRDYLLDFEGEDMAFIRDSRDTDKIASDLKMSKNKLLNDTLGKYETFLKSRNLHHRMKLRVATDSEKEKVIVCLNKKQQTLLSVYFQFEVQASLPGIEQMQRLLSYKSGLAQVPRDPYTRPWTEVENYFHTNFLKSHLSCEGIIDSQSLGTVFQSNLALHKHYYVKVRERLEKEAVLTIGRHDN